MNWPSRLLLMGVALLGTGAGTWPGRAADANRLVYLDGEDPFYAGIDTPPLLTPQWVGEPGVEAVVTLGLDDLNGNAPKYEAFLRPILDRLRAVSGRAPVSIFCNAIEPTNALVRQWLSEGVNLEVHTLSHPCPILAKSNFLAAVDTFVGGIDLMNHIPGNRPVAFRTPCCDSINSPSPRVYAELFPRTTRDGHFLQADSSVMNLLTADDPVVEGALAGTGRSRLDSAAYLPFTNFVTTIRNHPYPYVIGRSCWEFPAVVPSDWEAQNRVGPNQASTVAAWKTVLDVIVAKQGTFNLIFHPHGWILPGQVVEWIDHAVRQHGARVRFLNFRDAMDRINTHLLGGEPLRASDGSDNGVRVLDVNADGHPDVVIGNGRVQRTRVWNPSDRTWREGAFPTDVRRVRWAVMLPDGGAVAFRLDEDVRAAWRFEEGRWVEQRGWLAGLSTGDGPVMTSRGGRDRGVRFRDLDHDGRCELVVANDSQNAVFRWNTGAERWEVLPWALPKETAVVTADGLDAGLRWVDVNGDGWDDVLFSDEARYSLHLFVPKPVLGWSVGWTREVMAEPRTRDAAVPPIVRSGPARHQGLWIHGKSAWWQNEDTAHLPGLVARRTFDDLLRGYVPEPRSPEASLAAMVVAPGFRVELVAAEPLVRDPVAFDWDAHGRLWVAEMADYPMGMDGRGRPGGRIRVLEDSDGDGKPDRSTVFLDGVRFPNGVTPWRDGVLISAAPDILFAADRDGDGAADVVETLFEGFREGNQQHRANGFEPGLDGWYYAANGDSGGEVRPAGSDQSVSIYGRDFRILPGKGRVEAIEGQTQFGRRRDDWGNWFGNNNGTWAWHYHLPEHYVARNPLLPVERNKRFLANYPDSTRLFAIARMMQRFNTVGANDHCSSANSAAPYRDELFGRTFERTLFISEPVYNLVHREQLEPSGVSFASHRASGETNREFLASTDAWFRPTMVRTGPDGALYVADMYRLVIEHPEWIPPDVAARLDLRAGDTRGRLYRIVPDKAVLRPIPDLASLAPSALVRAMDSPNGWQRDTVQRLILETRPASAMPVLERLALRATRPSVRLQALATLGCLGTVPEALLHRCLDDPHPSVREQAIRLCEPRLRGDPGNGTLLAHLLRTVEDPHPRVRYQLAFTLGESTDSRAAHALVRLALRAADDPDQQVAVASSLRPHAAPFLEHLDRRAPADNSFKLVRDLAAAVLASRDTPPVTGVPAPTRASPAPADRTRAPFATASSPANARGTAPPARSAPSPGLPSSPARGAVVQAWIPKVQAETGSSSRGRQLFLQHCAACHRFLTLGRGAGPELASLTDYSVTRMVTAILDPSQAVDERYRTQFVRMKNGDEFLGIIESQGPNSVTLQTADGERQTLLRVNTAETVTLPASMMPEGLEATLTPRDIADLITFLGRL